MRAKHSTLIVCFIASLPLFFSPISAVAEEEAEEGSGKVITEEYTSEVDPLLSFGVQSAVSGKIKEAVKQFEEAYNKAPDVPDVMYGYAWALNRSRRYIEAEMILYRLKKVAPEYPGLVIESAIAHLGANHLDKAVEVLAPYEKNLTGDAAFIYGITLLKTGKTERALVYLEQAMEQEELKPAAAYHLISAYEQTGNKGKADEMRQYLQKRGGTLAIKAEGVSGAASYYRSQKHSDWKLDISAGSYFDSNLDVLLVGEPLFIEGKEGNDKASGGRGFLGAFGGYKIFNSPSFGFLLNGFLYQHLAFSPLDSPQERSADITRLGMDGTIEFRGPGSGFAWVLGLILGGEHEWLRLMNSGEGGVAAGFPREAGATLYADLGWTSYTVTRFEVSERIENYSFEERLNIDDDDRRSGLSSAGGLYQRFYFMGRGMVRIGFGANLHNAEGRYKDFMELNGAGGLIFPAASFLDIQAGGQLGVLQFGEGKGSAKRKDTRILLKGGLVFFVTDSFTIIGETGYNTGESNEDFYDFNNIVAGGRLVYSF
ncbi:MAG: hypothetical protein Kow0090_21730 [Myxococcota bacterium]